MCSLYYEPFTDDRYRRVMTVSRSEHGALRDVASVRGSTQQPTFEVPNSLDPMLTLALGMRAGFPRQPSLPIRRESEGERNSINDLPTDLLQYALKHGDRREQPLLLNPVEGLTTGLGSHPSELTVLVGTGRINEPSR